MKDIYDIFKDIEGLVDLIDKKSPSFEQLRDDATAFAQFKNFKQDLDSLQNTIFELYQEKYNKPASFNDLTATLTELLPDSTVKLNQMNSTLAALAKTNWVLSEAGSGFFPVMYALTNRMHLLQSPEQSLSAFKKNQRLSQSAPSLAQREAEEEKEIKAKPKDSSEQAFEIAQLIRSQIYDDKELKIQAHLHVLEKLVSSLPPDILSVKVQDNNTDQLITLTHQAFATLFHEEEQRGRAEEQRRFKVYEACEDYLNTLHIQLSNAIHIHLSQLKAGLTQPSLKKLENELEELNHFSTTLIKHSADLNSYADLAETFAKEYLNALISIHESYHSPEEKGVRDKEAIALKYLDTQIDPNKFKYKLSGQDLVKSSNRYLREVRSAYHPTKIIIPTRESNNLEQVLKDYIRGLQLNGLSISRSSYQKLAAKNKDELAWMKELLQTEFGNANAEKMIQHYNQNMSYITLAPIMNSLSKGNELVVFQQPDSFRQNVYEENEMLYQDIVMEKFAIVLPNPEAVEDNHWVFKTAVRTHGWLSEEGFKTDVISTDSPLVTLAFNQERCADYLIKVIQLVTEMKQDYQTKLDSLAKEKKHYGLDYLVTFKDNREDKRNILSTALLKIELFKTGEITLDELISGLSSAKQAALDIPHSNPVMGLYSNYVSNVPSKTYGLLSGKLEPLLALNEELKKLALPYKTVATPPEPEVEEKKGFKP